VAVKDTLWLTRLELMGWLKLKERLFVPPATSTGVKPGVLLTPPEVFTQVTPHETSKVSDGLIDDRSTIRTTTLILVDNGLATVAVQLCVPPVLERLILCAHWILLPTRDGSPPPVTVTLMLTL